MARIDVRAAITGADLTVTSGEQSASDSGDLTLPALPNADYTGFVQVAKQARAAEPFSFTSTKPYNGFQKVTWGYGFAPIIYSNYSTVLGVDGQTVHIAGLSGGGVWAPEMYVGARLRAFRVSNNEMSQIRSSAVVAANFRIGGADDRMDWLRLETGTTCSIKVDNYSRPGKTYYFAVAAVDSAGKLGPLSNWAAYTPTVLNTGPDSDIGDEFSLVSGAGSLAAPTGLVAVNNATGDGTADLSWNAVPGAVGYWRFRAFNDPATHPANDYLELADDGGTALQAGDMVIWDKAVVNIPADTRSNRIYNDGAGIDGFRVPGVYGNGSWSDHLDYEGKPSRWIMQQWDAENPKPDASLGDWRIKWTMLPGAQWISKTPWASGRGGFWYKKEAGTTFRADVWIKASEARSATFAALSPVETPQSFTLPTTWTLMSFTSTSGVPDTDQVLEWMFSATAGASGLTIEMAGLKCYLEEDGAFGDFIPDFAASTVPGQAFRDHSLVKTRAATYSGAQMVAPRGECAHGVTLSMQLDACIENNLQPWAQPEWALPREDWILFANTYGASAYLFDVMHIEGGNENWQNGSLGGFWGPFPQMTDTVTAEVYNSAEVEGLYLSMIYRWMQEADNWELLEPKLEFHICGQTTGNYGEQVYSKFPQAKHVNGAFYGSEGWDVGASNPTKEEGADFARTMAFVDTWHKPYTESRIAGLTATATSLGKVYGVDVDANWYEGMAGYAIPDTLSDADEIKQEVFNKSRAGVAANTNQALYAQLKGLRPNYFTIGYGNTWKSHAEDGHAYLLWDALRTLADKLGTYYVHPILTMRNDYIPGFGTPVEKVAAFGLQSVADPSHWILVAINRGIDPSVLETDDPDYDAGDTGVASVVLHTIFQSAETCSVMTAGIGNMREHDRYPVGYRVNTSGTYDADPLSVGAFDTSWSTVDVPANIGRISIDDDLGADVGGLRGGNFLMVELTGVT